MLWVGSHSTLYNGVGRKVLSNRKMTATDFFNRVSASEVYAKWIFRTVLCLSIVVLVVPEEWNHKAMNPVLIVCCLIGFILSVATSAWQNEGNQLLRATQLTSAFNVPLGSPPALSYYNNAFPPSVDRLAATTLENSLFTLRVLQRMLHKERLILVSWCVVFVLSLALRWTSTSFLLVLAQTVFSVDVGLHWFRMERFNHRVARVHDALRQFFVQAGSGATQTGVAIALASFSNYECAKDEAGLAIDERIFNKLNPQVSKEWDDLRKAIGIP
jgi:hypothetical protein